MKNKGIIFKKLFLALAIIIIFGGVLLGYNYTRQKTITETKNRATIFLTKEEKVKKRKMALAILDAILAEGRTAPVELWPYDPYLDDVDSFTTTEGIAQYARENKNECSLSSVKCAPVVYPDAYFNKKGKFISLKPYKNCIHFFDCFPDNKRFVLVERVEI